MTSKTSIRNRFTRRLAARVLGACMLAGAAVAATTPAQAVIYMSPVGDNYIYQDATPAFQVQTHVQDYGWINAFGTTGEGRRLEAIRVTQLTNNVPGLCLQPYVSTLGWMNMQCTSGPGTMIEVGTTGRSLAIQGVFVNLNGAGPVTLTGSVHLANYGWESMMSSLGIPYQLLMGYPGAGVDMQAFYLTIHEDHL